MSEIYAYNNLYLRRMFLGLFVWSSIFEEWIVTVDHFERTNLKINGILSRKIKSKLCYIFSKFAEENGIQLSIDLNKAVVGIVTNASIS